MRIKKSFRKILAAAIAAGTFAAMPLVSAEVKEYEGFGEYVMSDFETPDVAKQRAKARAEQNAMEQAGVYLESRTEVVDSQITKDEIKTITNGILTVINVKYDLKPIVEDGGSFLVAARITATIETDEIQKWLQRDVAEKEKLVKQNKELEIINAKQEQEIANLKQQIAKTKNVDDKDILKGKIKNADKEFLAMQKVEEGNREVYEGNREGAIELYSNAIEIDPYCVEAYKKRGCLYGLQGNGIKEIEDYTTAIKIAPNDVDSYISRAFSWKYLGNIENAINDFDSAIRIDPNMAATYWFRGHFYEGQKEYEKALLDYSMFIKIAPAHVSKEENPLSRVYPSKAQGFYSRGLVYAKVKKYAEALSDYQSAIQLDTTSSYHIYNVMGKLYGRLGEFEKAIAAFTNAIDIDSKGAQAYFFRGVAYSELHEYQRAITDYSNAIKYCPNYADAYQGRSIAWRSIGEYDKAHEDDVYAKHLRDSAIAIVPS